MNTVLPAFERPVTPSRIVGLNKCAPNSTRAWAASRSCSKRSANQRLLHGCFMAASKPIIFASTKLLPWVIENHSCQEQAEPQRMGRAHEYSLDHHHRICGGSDREIPSSREQVRA